MKKGILITFEGPEGSGKSTQIRLLAEYLRKWTQRKIEMTREPGGTLLGTQLRHMLLNFERFRNPLEPLTELLLYEADRAQHVKQRIIPALIEGKIVLCDRFTDSTVAYQGYARKLDIRMIQTLNAIACDGVKPDLTILLDVPVRRGLKQAKARKNHLDRLERAGIHFHERVRKGFLQLARAEPKRFKIVAQETGIAGTFVRIQKIIDPFLKTRGVLKTKSS